jgi:hypothetical protein
MKETVKRQIQRGYSKIDIEIIIEYYNNNIITCHLYEYYGNYYSCDIHMINKENVIEIFPILIDIFKNTTPELIFEDDYYFNYDKNIWPIDNMIPPTIILDKD